MRIAKLEKLLWVLACCAMLWAGCSGSSESPPPPSGTFHTVDGSGLRLYIPDGLEVSQADIDEIHAMASQVPHCRYSSGQAVDIRLAEACVLYFLYYLFPENFPQSLDGISSVEQYVEQLQQQDPYTFYLTAEEFSDFLLQRDGEIAYIGIVYQFEGELVTPETPMRIIDVIPHTRAWIDGIQAGDVVVGIDGLSILGLEGDAVLDLLPSEEGAAVVITVERDGAPIEIHTAPEENIALLLAPDTAYLSVRSFTDITGVAVEEDFNRLLADAGQPIEKLILDLRGNTGGAVSGAVDLTDYLIDRDVPPNTYPIFSIDGTIYHNQFFYLGDWAADNIGDFEADNFVVLVDGDTASSSEITAAALQYYGAATLMGSQTFGKGLSQSVFELLDGAGVWIPAHNIYPPSGLSYHDIGLTPDIVDESEPQSFAEDPLLEEALAFLNGGQVAVAGGGETRHMSSLDNRSAGAGDPFRQTLGDRKKQR